MMRSIVLASAIALGAIAIVAATPFFGNPPTQAIAGHDTDTMLAMTDSGFNAKSVVFDKTARTTAAKPDIVLTASKDVLNKPDPRVNDNISAATGAILQMATITGLPEIGPCSACHLDNSRANIALGSVGL